MSRLWSPQIDRPNPSPIRGAYAALSYYRFFRDPVRCLTKLYRRNGPLTVLGHLARFGQREVFNIVALGPEYNRQVLGNPAVYYAPGQVVPGPRDSAMQRIRSGLTKMNGDKHRRQRQLLLPLFTPSAIQGYGEEIARIASEQIANWPVGQQVDMWHLLRQLTQRVSARLLFGRVDPEQADLLGGPIRDYIAKSFSAGAFLLRLNWPGLPYRGLVLSAERMERDLLAMVRERRQAPETARPDMLDRLIKARDEDNGQMDDGDLVGQMAILFAASFETQTNALAWTLYLLAQHPQIIGDLHDELAAKLQGQAPIVGQLTRLPLLDAVLKESLRILPPVPYNLRRVGEPSELGGFPVLPRYRVVCSPYITHHMPELYDEPERFDPLRWQTIRPGPYEYLPFSAGPRICIGATMSMATMKILLATMLQRWRLAIVPGSRIQRTFEFTMRPKYGLPMIIHPQDRAFAAADVRGNIHEMVDLTPRPVILKFPSRELPQQRYRRAA